MLLIVQTQAADRPDVFPGQRRKKHLNFGDLVCDIVLSEDVTLDHLCLGHFGKVADAHRENGITVVNLAVFGQESNESLSRQ